VLSRRWAVFLVGVGVWTWVIWPRFALAIWNDPRAWSSRTVGEGAPSAFFWVHALLIGAEGAGLEAILRRLPPTLRHVYMVLAVMLGWLLLRSATLGDARIFARALIGANGPVVPTGLTFGYDVWLTLAAGAIGCAPLSPMVRRWTVAIDALIVSALMASLASLLFTWRGVRMVVNPVIRFWRGSPDAAGRP